MLGGTIRPTHDHQTPIRRCRAMNAHSKNSFGFQEVCRCFVSCSTWQKSNHTHILKYSNQPKSSLWKTGTEASWVVWRTWYKHSLLFTYLNPSLPELQCHRTVCSRRRPGKPASEYLYNSLAQRAFDTRIVLLILFDRNNQNMFAWARSGNASFAI